ncbi:MAG: hypothetical protein K1W30_04995 [Lachnospiraceae bacterium]
MQRQELYEKALKEQEGRIQEMEQVISLLEKENSLQWQHSWKKNAGKTKN